MIIEVLLFAAARELTGRDVVEIEVAAAEQHGERGADATSPCEEEYEDTGNANCVLVSCIIKALTQQYPELKQLLPSCRIAVNCQYVGPDASVPLGAEVALIPPVSGG